MLRPLARLATIVVAVACHGRGLILLLAVELLAFVAILASTVVVLLFTVPRVLVALGRVPAALRRILITLRRVLLATGVRVVVVAACAVAAVGAVAVVVVAAEDLLTVTVLVLGVALVKAGGRELIRYGRLLWRGSTLFPHCCRWPVLMWRKLQKTVGPAHTPGPPSGCASSR